MPPTPPTQPMPETEILLEAKRIGKERALAFITIIFSLIGDALLFILWILISWCCEQWMEYLKAHGLKSASVESCFLFVSHWGVFALATAYVAFDLAVVLKENWKRVRS
jgi:hypothetical protein